MHSVWLLWGAVVAEDPISSRKISFPTTWHYQIREQRQEAPLSFYSPGRTLPIPYPLSDFSPNEHLQDERFIFCEIFHLSSLGTPGSPAVPWVPGRLLVQPPSQAKPHCSQVASVEKQKANCGCSQTFQTQDSSYPGELSSPHPRKTLCLGKSSAFLKVQSLRPTGLSAKESSDSTWTSVE